MFLPNMKLDMFMYWCYLGSEFHLEMKITLGLLPCMNPHVSIQIVFKGKWFVALNTTKGFFPSMNYHMGRQRG